MVRLLVILSLLFSTFSWQRAEAAAAVTATAATWIPTMTGNGTTATVALTIPAGSNLAIAVMIWWSTTIIPTITGATWNTSTNLSLLGSSNASNGGISTSSAVYCLAAPTTGTHNAAITWTGSQEYHIIALSFSGADQTTPCQNAATVTNIAAAASPITGTVTSATGDIVIAMAAENCTNITTVSGTTIATDNTTGGNLAVSANYTTGAATVSPTFAFAGTCGWSFVGADIKAAGGGGVGTGDSNLMLTGVGG